MCEYMVYTKMYISVECAAMFLEQTMLNQLVQAHTHSYRVLETALHNIDKQAQQDFPIHTKYVHTLHCHKQTLPKKSCSGRLCPGIGFCAVFCTLLMGETTARLREHAAEPTIGSRPHL